MRTIIVLLGIAVIVLVAVRLARAQSRAQAKRKIYPDKRDALFAGTLRGRHGDLPLVALEVRISEHNATILALFADGTIGHIRDQLRTVASMFTPGNDAMRALHVPFLNAMRAQEAAFTEAPPFAEPAQGYAVGYLQRGKQLVATLPVPADDPREGAVDLIAAYDAANELSQRLFQRSLRGL